MNQIFTLCNSSVGAVEEVREMDYENRDSSTAKNQKGNLVTIEDAGETDYVNSNNKIKAVTMTRSVDCTITSKDTACDQLSDPHRAASLLEEHSPNLKYAIFAYICTVVCCICVFLGFFGIGFSKFKQSESDFIQSHFSRLRTSSHKSYHTSNETFLFNNSSIWYSDDSSLRTLQLEDAHNSLNSTVEKVVTQTHNTLMNETTTVAVTNTTQTAVLNFVFNTTQPPVTTLRPLTNFQTSFEAISTTSHSVYNETSSGEGATTKSTTIQNEFKCGTVSDGEVSENIFYKIPSRVKKLAREGRVIGGTDAEIQQYPWQVFLDAKSGQCGGSIVNNSWIVFAAHCVTQVNSNAEEWKVFAGLSNRDHFDHYGQVARGVKIVKHGRFVQNTFENDIALLKIFPSFQYNDFVRPICLPSPSMKLSAGVSCGITGWGLTNESLYVAPKILQAAKVVIIKRDICNLPNWLANYVKSNMICAGSYTGHVDGCVGDSGGPLACSVGNQKYLFGISSWGVGCGVKTKPGVYTKVTSYISWIEKNMK